MDCHFKNLNYLHHFQRAIEGITLNRPVIKRECFMYRAYMKYIIINESKCTESDFKKSQICHIRCQSAPLLAKYVIPVMTTMKNDQEL